MTIADGDHPRRWAGAMLRRWPSVLGLPAAGFQLATGADREAVAITVAAATLCYLAAAALDRPWIAWAMIAGTGLIVVAENSPVSPGGSRSASLRQHWPSSASSPVSPGRR